MASALPGNTVTTSTPPKQIRCPQCLNSECRVVEGHRCVCRSCSKSQRKIYYFCWACQREWPRSRLQSLGGICPLPGCAKRASLLSEETIKDTASAAFGCPFFRACPSCNALLTHSGVGCRNITCPQCHTEFCFRCLRQECCFMELDDEDYLSDYEDDGPVELCVIVGNYSAIQKI